jgi:hypothetical protein
MWRTVLAIVAGLIAWVLIGAIGFALMRGVWPDYARAEPEMAFTLPMQLARLTVGVACSVGGGWLAAVVAKGDSRPAWWLGALLLVLFVPIHYSLWDRFPIWYHLTFLLSLAPIVGDSGRLASPARVAV